MQTDFLRYLIKIVECGSMNKAANDLFITQAALTKAMKKLETDLECKLLERTKKGVKLTEKGQRIYADAEWILSIEDSWQSLADDEQAIKGRVRVAVINSVCASAINRFLFNCREQYPGINVVLREYKDFDFLRQFEKRKADIGICHYINSDRENLYRLALNLDLEIEELCHDKFYIFMSAQNKLAKKLYLEKKDLTDLKFAVYSDEDDMVSAPFFMSYFKAENVFFMNSMYSMIRAILEENAVIFNTKVFANQNEYVARGEIVYKEVIDISLPTTYYMIRPDSRRISVSETIVANMLKDSMREIFENS